MEDLSDRMDRGPFMRPAASAKQDLCHIHIQKDADEIAVEDRNGRSGELPARDDNIPA